MDCTFQYIEDYHNPLSGWARWDINSTSEDDLPEKSLPWYALTEPITAYNTKICYINPKS